MSELLGTPIHGTVAADTFEPLLPPEEINRSLVEEWRLYLTDCLKNNFSLVVSLSIATSGGTTLWIPQERRHEVPPKVREKLLGEFARECLRDFVRLLTGRRMGMA